MLGLPDGSDMHSRFLLATLVLVLVVAAVGGAVSNSMTGDSREPGSAAAGFNGSYGVTMSDVPVQYRDVVVPVSDREPRTSRYVNTVRSANATAGRHWHPINAPYQNTSKIYEVTQHPDQRVTIAELNNAWALYNQTYTQAVENEWFNGVADGYRAVDRLHYVNVPRLHEADGLTPRKPESLLYREVERSDGESERRLVGAMYLQHDFSAGAQVGGPLTVWHWHELPTTPTCPNVPTTRLATRNVTDSQRQSITPSGFDDCTDMQSRTPEMLHVWFEPRPLGPFSTGMTSKQSPPEQYDRMNKSEFIAYTLQTRATQLGNTTVKSS